MKHILTALVLAIMLSGCLPMPEARANRALASQGYTNVTLTGLAIFGCSEDDVFRQNFEATGRDGKRITGTVCGGLLKGTTVRLD